VELSQNTHCLNTSIVHQLYEIALSGSGYIQALIEKSSNQVSIFFISDTLTLSLASLLYHCIAKNAMVQSIARIAITTMSSTKVKPFLNFTETTLIFINKKIK